VRTGVDVDAHLLAAPYREQPILAVLRQETARLTVRNLLKAAQRAFAAANQCLSPPGDHFSVKLNR
jgi:hypothetical protein